MIHEARFKQFEEGDPAICCEGLLRLIKNDADDIMLVNPGKVMTFPLVCLNCDHHRDMIQVWVVKSRWHDPACGNWVCRDFIDINEEPYLNSNPKEENKNAGNTRKTNDTREDS